MTHPLLRSEIFVETAFEKRFQAMLRSAWHNRSWHVIVADRHSRPAQNSWRTLDPRGGSSEKQ